MTDKVKNSEGRRWELLIEQVRKLEFELATASEVFERERKDNIEKRYQLLKAALEIGCSSEQTLQRIAELGAEFGAHKAFEYCGGSPF